MIIKEKNVTLDSKSTKRKRGFLQFKWDTRNWNKDVVEGLLLFGKLIFDFDVFDPCGPKR